MFHCKKNKINTRTKCVNLEDILLSEISQPEQEDIT
jgi:hypothetical protein